MPQSFESLLSNELILKNLKEALQFHKPTPIQEAAIPAILSGRDVYAGAKTGSGKTMAYMLPVFERILKGEVGRALVLAPTRELALQIDEEAMKIVEGQSAVVSIPLYGGVPIDPQILALRTHKPRVLITTPGRVLDLVQEGALTLEQIEIVVLDEADRMCDMGFAPQVTQIMDLVKDRQQTLLFSATLPKELNDIMDRFAKNPLRIQVDASDKASDTIEHFVLICRRNEKMRHLVDIVSKPDVISVIFTKTRNKSDEVYDGLRNKIDHLAVLHAGLPMADRERTLRALKEGKVRTLVSTDVFSRGIDIDDITHVIHYDMPQNLEDYIHRSGRSGRAGKEGTTIAFADKDNPDQMRLVQSIAQKVKLKTWGEGALHSSEPPQQDQRSHRPDREQRFRGRDRGPRQDLGRSGSGHKPHRDGTKASQSSSRPHSARPHREKPPSRAEKPSPGVKKKPSIISKTKSLLKKVFGKKAP